MTEQQPPNVPVVQMPSKSRHAGQLADMTSRRSIQIRSDSSPAIPADAGVAIIDYFFHAGDFWTAKVTLDCVSQIRGQAFNFSKVKTRKTTEGPEPIRDERGIPRRQIPMLNHVQVRFLTHPDQPIELYKLGSDDFSDPQHVIDDFVYSLEAVGPTGVNFNFMDGMTGALMGAHRFMSTEEMVFERIVVENQYLIETAAIALSKAERRQALIEALLRSNDAGWTEPYYLCRCWGTNNCMSNPFQILDRIRQPQLRHRLGALLYRLPLKPRWYLWLRGLDANPDVKNLVREEFSQFIDDQRVQQRKREYVRAQIRARRAAKADW